MCQLKDYATTILFCKRQDSSYFTQKKIYTNYVVKNQKDKFYSSWGKYFAIIVRNNLLLYKVEGKSTKEKKVRLKLNTKIPKDAAYHLSDDAKFLCIRNYTTYIFVNAQNGEQVGAYTIENVPKDKQVVLFNFIDSKHMIGVHRKRKFKSIFIMDASSPTSGYSKVWSNLEFKNFTFDLDGNYCLAEGRNSLYFIDYKNKTDPVEILTDYDRIVKKNIIKGRVSVLYVQQNKHFFSFFAGVKRVYRVYVKINADPAHTLIYSNDRGQIVYIERLSDSIDQGISKPKVTYKG